MTTAQGIAGSRIQIGVDVKDVTLRRTMCGAKS
jgi:hypothetical protein